MAERTVTINDTSFSPQETPAQTGDTIKFVNARNADVTVTLHGLLKLETYLVPRNNGTLLLPDEIKAGDSTHTITAPAAYGEAPIKGTIKVGTGLPG